MTQEKYQSRESGIPQRIHESGSVRPHYVVLVATFLIAQVPVVSAHSANATAQISQEHGIFLALIGIVLLGGFILLKRMNRITPKIALYGVFVGIVVTTLGAILFEGLSSDPSYSAGSMPIPRSWYQPLALFTGFGIMATSSIIGRLRWPARPRYTVLGIVMGLWVSYPYLIPGPASDTHPLGYAIVLGTPVIVGYVVCKDARSPLRAVLRDPVARRFGIGISVVLALFFLSVTGYLSFFQTEGAPHDVTVVVLPAIYQLVMWPTLEIAIPHIPFFLAVSPGQIIVIGMLSALVGLNGALIARHWRVEKRAGMTQGTAGSAAIVGTCTCGCCGPLVAKIAVLVAGPSIAAPLYWMFADSASPLSTLFIVGSVFLFTGSITYSIRSAHQSEELTAIISSD